MTKKFTLMMLFLMLLGAASFSQTASLATVTASPGQNVPVALNVTGFTGIGSITFHIQFDPAVMTLTGITLPVGSPWLTQGTFWGVNGNTINIVGVWSSNTNFPNSKMFDLNFTYSGMTSSPLNFLGNCEVTQGLTLIHPTYTNGSVSMAVVSTEARLIPVTASTGGDVSLPLEYKNFATNVSAITQVIHYDATKLNFVSVTGTGNLATGINFNGNSSTGTITITWTSAAGKDINSDVFPYSKFLLNFVYIGNSVTNVNFVGGCLISSPVPVTNIAVTYYSSSISPGLPTATAKLGAVTGAIQGQDYEVPLTLGGFPSGTAGGTQAFTLTIPYDYPRLSYLGLTDPVAGLIVSQASGTLTLAWSNASGPDINGTFLKLKFKYNGIGTANVSFGNGCVFNTYNAGMVGTVQVAYTDATIAPVIASAKATIGMVTGVAVGSNVNVPISFSGLPSMGAVTLNVIYDYNKLTYIDVQNNIFGANVQLNPTTHVLKIAWNSLGATNLNVPKFLDLRFTYNGGGGGCGCVAVSFTDGCELADFGAAIISVNYVNGGVNLLKISGILSYNSDPLTRIPLDGFTVNLKTSPGNLIVGSAVTTSAGYFEIWTANGNYHLDAISRPVYSWYADFDDVLALFDYTFGTPLPEENALRLKAGDVTQSGDIDFDDVLALFDRTFGNVNPNYTAPDWIFEQPAITVSCIDLPNQDFMALNSGNVRGTNPTP